MAQPENATFYTFKKSGKYAYEGRGHLSPQVFERFDKNGRYHQILEDNGGSIPGMSGNGVGYFIVVIGDEANPHGWPLHIDMTYAHSTVEE